MSQGDEKKSGSVNRRDFIRLGALAAAGASMASSTPLVFASASQPQGLEEVTIAELQARMASGQLTSLMLVNQYISRIESLDRSGPKINSILEINPDARAIAQQLDAERAARGPRGLLHGIPIVLKDNIDTADRMTTAAGSLALVGAPPSQDATVSKRLRDAGAVILGKTNLSEWANFRSFHSSSGWSGRGGQCRNPYALARNPCGSSSGSAASVSANLVAVAIGTETDGSIVCPASMCGVVGIKPTVGLTSRAGVVPISHSQDTVGPFGRTVADAAAVLGALTGVDPRDPATQGSDGHFFHDYTQFLNPDGLRGARIGVARNTFWGYSEETDAIGEAALQAIRDAGAVVIDPADIPTADVIFSDPAELIVLIYEFKRDLNAYLATRTGVPVRTLADVIEFDNEHASKELKYFLQELFDLAEADPFSHDDYVAALKRSHQLSRQQGIDAVMNHYNLDAIVAPTLSPAFTTDLVNGDHILGGFTSPPAMAGYPHITVPAGFTFGLPVGMSFCARAYAEPALIKLASGFEAATKVRRPPQFLAQTPRDDSASRQRQLRTLSDSRRLKQAFSPTGRGGLAMRMRGLL